MIKTLYKKYNLMLVAENEQEYECQQLVQNQVLSTQVAVQVNNVFNLNKRADESLIMLCLDNHNYITAAFEVARGSLNCTLVNISDLFKRALTCNSHRIILCHNHPSRFCFT